MRIIPVIDVLQGKVVHAVKGYREKYLPLKSELFNTLEPTEVAAELKRIFGFEELYVADLDGIMKGTPNLDMISSICKIGDLKVLVDSGVNNSSKANKLLQTGVSNIVVGTETLCKIEDLLNIIKLSGDTPVTGSIDIRDGKVLSQCNELVDVSPSKAAKILEDNGVKQIILLDISKVGSESGVEVGLAELILNSINIPLLVGGSVSTIKDIFALREIGVSGVLMATVLHKTRLTKFDINFIKSLAEK